MYVPPSPGPPMPGPRVPYCVVPAHEDALGSVLRQPGCVRLSTEDMSSTSVEMVFIMSRDNDHDALKSAYDRVVVRRAWAMDIVVARAMNRTELLSTTIATERDVFADRRQGGSLPQSSGRTPRIRSGSPALSEGPGRCSPPWDW
jgi:hypothetical protein